MEEMTKSAVIVGESANFELAVDACLTSVSKLSGQRCVSASRLIVHRSLFQKFCNEFAFKFAGLKMGDPLKEDFDYGPLINSDAVGKVRSYNEMAMADNDCNTIVRGVSRFEEGYFIGPLAYSCEWDNTKPFLVEEVFGPHVAVIPYDTIEEAVKIYNDTEYGLSCALISEDYREMRYVKNEADYGMFYVNLPGVGAESFCPFGGVKKSGNGWPSAARTYQAVTDEVVCTINHSQEGFEMAQGLK
jgi:aldehyde dehydrogenase (NAD+)